MMLRPMVSSAPQLLFLMLLAAAMVLAARSVKMPEERSSDRCAAYGRLLDQGSCDYVE